MKVEDLKSMTKKDPNWIDALFDQEKIVRHALWDLEKIQEALWVVFGETQTVLALSDVIENLRLVPEEISRAVNQNVDEAYKSSQKSSASLLTFLLNPRVQILPAKAAQKEVQI